MIPGEWIEQARCAGMDVDIFFPEPRDAQGRARATNICRRCPVRVQCAEFGRNQPFGIWGGRTRYASRTPVGYYRDNEVLAVGAMRRLQALARLGYSSCEVARALRANGYTASMDGLNQVRLGRSGYIRDERNDAITAIYELIVYRGPCTAGSSYSVSVRAEMAGWARPEDWRGVDIDDMDSRPCTRRSA